MGRDGRWDGTGTGTDERSAADPYFLTPNEAPHFVLLSAMEYEGVTDCGIRQCKLLRIPQVDADHAGKGDGDDMTAAATAPPHPPFTRS